MDESSITIRWEKNPDDCTDISVSGYKDYLCISAKHLYRWICYHRYIVGEGNKWRECWKFGYNSTSHSANSNYPKERWKEWSVYIGTET